MPSEQPREGTRVKVVFTRAEAEALLLASDGYFSPDATNLGLGANKIAAALEPAQPQPREGTRVNPDGTEPPDYYVGCTPEPDDWRNDEEAQALIDAIKGEPASEQPTRGGDELATRLEVAATYFDALAMTGRVAADLREAARFLRASTHPEQSERVDLEWAFRLMRDCLQAGKEPEDYEQDRLDEIADALTRPTPTEQGEARIHPRDPGEHIWSCKIGGLTGPLPDGSDAPMRRAVEDAFVQVTGGTDEFCFSGWGATLTEGERECVDADTEPAPEGEGEAS